MLRNSKSIVLICGATAIAATVVFYLMIFDNILTIPIRWISLVFLVLTECIGTIKILCVKRTIFGVANIITSLFHFGIVLVMSIIFVDIFPRFIKTYVLLNILLLCILFFVNTIICYFGKYIDNKNK